MYCVNNTAGISLPECVEGPVYLRCRLRPHPADQCDVTTRLRRQGQRGGAYLMDRLVYGCSTVEFCLPDRDIVVHTTERGVKKAPIVFTHQSVPERF